MREQQRSLAVVGDGVSQASLLSGGEQAEVHVGGVPRHVGRTVRVRFTGNVNKARVNDLVGRGRARRPANERQAQESACHSSHLHSMSPRPVLTMRPSSFMAPNSLSKTPFTKAPDFSVL